MQSGSPFVPADQCNRQIGRDFMNLAKPQHEEEKEVRLAPFVFSKTHFAPFYSLKDHEPMNEGANSKGTDDLTESISENFQPTSRPELHSSHIKVDIAGATHCGYARENNEDHYLAVKFQRSLETVCTNIEENNLEPVFDEIGYGLLVADGMGGLEAGEVASQLALCKLVELVVNNPDWIMRFNQPRDETIVMQRITQRFRQVDEALRDVAHHERWMSGMGTTLTLAISLGSTLLIGHVGDSRAYVMRGNTLHQLTKDHTLAQALLDAGITNHDDLTTRTLRHVLTAALGATDELSDPQVLRFKLSHNDQVLLCTDGLTEAIAPEMIASILSEADSSQAACNSLIDLALSEGAVDNVTMVLARYYFPKAPEPLTK
jgi:protein phosphatase